MAFFGRKVIFSISDVPERFKESISMFPANFKKISESQIFEPFSNHTLNYHYLNMGRVYSVLMPAVTLKNFVTNGHLKVG